MRNRAFDEKAVADRFAAYPAEIRNRLLALRALIYEVADATEGVGALQETLKWGQPSYLTPETKSGSTVRIDAVKANPGMVAAYFHCQSGLVPAFREQYGDELNLQGNRAILIGPEDDVPADILQRCLALALTHHLRKKKGQQNK